MAVENGDRVKDIVSGFKGTVIAVTTYLSGCRRVLVQPDVDKAGKLPESVSFDVDTVKVTKKGAVTPVSQDTGGPSPIAAAPPAPRR
jgi:hypothetical protein